MADERREDAVWIGNSLAPAWEANADFIARSGEKIQRWMVSHLDPQPGETVLELGAGPGDTGFEVAQKLGTDGRLISTDISPEMVEVARRRSQNFGVTNVDFRVMDAQRLDVEGASVDGVVHRFGPMLLPDADASFKEVRRALADGGRYVAAVFSAPQHNPWLMTMAMSAMQSGVQLEGGNPAGPGGPFSMGDPEEVRRRVEAAGFAEVVVEPVEQVFRFADADEGFERLSTLAGPLAMILSGLPAKQRNEVKKAYATNVEPFRTDEGLAVPGQALGIFAR
jgi:ubiquinone/menaquinone biosynthesis C-methylase UbiE